MPDNQESSRNEDGTFKVGVSGNPSGRPKGVTLKEYARQYYIGMTDEEKAAYIKRVEDKRPGFVWEMAEGKAKQDVEADITIASKVISLDE